MTDGTQGEEEAWLHVSGLSVMRPFTERGKTRCRVVRG